MLLYLNLVGESEKGKKKKKKLKAGLEQKRSIRGGKTTKTDTFLSLGNEFLSHFFKMFNDTYVEKTKDKKMLKTEEEHINYQQLNILSLFILQKLCTYIYIYIDIVFKNIRLAACINIESKESIIAIGSMISSNK